MSDTAFVVVGATKFHAINWPATNALRQPECQRLARKIKETRSYRHEDSLFDEFRQAMVANGGAWRDIPYPYRLHSAKTLGPKTAVPRCCLTDIQDAVPIGEARARGLDWSKECAKAMGLVVDGRPPLVRVSWKGSRRAYMHALDCEVCWNEGVGKCAVFPLVAEQLVESDVDPRLDELLTSSS